MIGIKKITTKLIGALVGALIIAGTVSAAADTTIQSGACQGDVCVGQRAYNILRDYREVQIVGIESNGTFVLRFLDNGGVGGNWSRADLAVQRGCGHGFCVGDTAYNLQRNYRTVRVVGIHLDGKLVLRFDDNGGVGGNWENTDLAKMRGCGRLFCVGNVALNNKRNYREVRVVGIQSNGLYVLRFSDNGGVGGNWSDDDLVRTQGNPPPPPQPQPQPPYPPQPPPQGNYTVSGAGINMTQSPDQACYNYYRTRAESVLARGQLYTCTAETCGHPYDWSLAFCSRY
jgi:hypothetical protein